MLKDLVRDAPFGQLMRYITRNRVFLYPEEQPDFQCPTSYKDDGEKHHKHGDHDNTNEETPTATEPTESPPTEEAIPADLEKISSIPADLAKVESSHSSHSSTSGDLRRIATVGSHIERTRTLPWTEGRLEAEEALALQKSKTKSLRVQPTKTADGTVLVDW